MNETPSRLSFRVLSGTGDFGTTRKILQAKSPGLFVVKRQQRVPLQLKLPTSPPRHPTAISIGIDFIKDPVSLETILRQNFVQTVVDLRLSPSFSGWQLGRERFISVLEGLSVRYVHESDLANGFVGESFDERLVRQKYSAHVQTKMESLRRINAAMSAGPVLLISFGLSHESSDRAVVVDALAEHCLQFDLVLYQPRALQESSVTE